MSPKSGRNTVGRGPRGQAGPLLVQDSWRLTKRGDRLTREPIMVDVTTPWLPVS